MKTFGRDLIAMPRNRRATDVPNSLHQNSKDGGDLVVRVIKRDFGDMASRDCLVEVKADREAKRQAGASETQYRRGADIGPPIPGPLCQRAISRCLRIHCRELTGSSSDSVARTACSLGAPSMAVCACPSSLALANSRNVRATIAMLKTVRFIRLSREKCGQPEVEANNGELLEAVKVDVSGALIGTGRSATSRCSRRGS